MADPAAARRDAEEVFRAILDYEPHEVCKDEFAYDRMVENYRDAARKGLALLSAEPSAPVIKESLKTGPTIPEGDLGFDAIAYARDIVADRGHKDADEFSACARETLAAMLSAHDRLRQRHDTLFKNHALLMKTSAPTAFPCKHDPGLVCLRCGDYVRTPPARDEVREAAEAFRKVNSAQRDDSCTDAGCIVCKRREAGERLLAALAARKRGTP